jgi:hypothetical protein
MKLRVIVMTVALVSLAATVFAQQRKEITNGVHEFPDSTNFRRVIVFEDVNTVGDLDHDWGTGVDPASLYAVRKLSLHCWGDTLKVRTYCATDISAQVDSALVFPIEETGFVLALDFDIARLDSVEIWPKNNGIADHVVAGGYQYVAKTR